MANPETATSAKQPAKATTNPVNKTRVVRRRGPARNDEDDGIIERAALSDTESEQSDTDRDPESEDDETGEEHHASGPTPASKPADGVPPAVTTTPPLTDAATPPPTNGTSSNEASHIWSDMVATEQVEGKHNDESDLPVIDFADLCQAPVVDEILNKTESASVETPASPPPPQPAAASTKNNNPKPKSAGAREIYLAKLKDDPAYTPRVGQFWGHDDRLMDKELRGMSDWWRGRWTGRGRGGFAGRGGRGGRGGVASDRGGGTSEPMRWDHDGYEELLKQGEGRGRSKRGVNGGGLHSTRGWFKEKEGRGGSARGGARGGRGGGQPARPATQNEIQAQLQAQAAAQIASSASTTPAQVPVETAAETPIAGPSNAGATAKPPLPPKAPKAAVNPRAKLNGLLAQASTDRAAASAKSVIAQAKDEIAAASTNGTAPTAAPSTAPSKPTTAASSSANPTTAAPVRVNLPKVPRAPRNTRQNQTQKDHGAATSAGRRQQQAAPAVSVPPQVSLPAQNLTFGTADPAAVASNATSPTTSQAPPSHPGPTPATSSAPPPPPSNPGYSYVALPPGIAMGESGLLYEVATGRPVVLNQPPLPQPIIHSTQPTPPSPATSAPPPQPQPQMVPMYNPRPILHSQTAAAVGARSFIPQHVLNTMPHHQHTPDLSGGGYPYGAGSPTPPAGDSLRGTPTFFAPPRQSGKLQIRAPGSAATSEKPLYASSPISPTYQSRPPYDQTSYYGAGGVASSAYYNPPTSQQNTGGTAAYTASGQVGEDGYYGGGSTYYPHQGYGGYGVGPPGADYGYGAAGMVGDGSYGGTTTYPRQDNRDGQQQQQQQPTMHGYQQGQQQVYY
ncbi:hypothetical protein FRB94_005643 [Tulasnella sp. JGI-2019a]|nr:hypothetical protein FRB94_005643 [Tulasnella sp. JGI-2019a]